MITFEIEHDDFFDLDFLLGELPKGTKLYAKFNRDFCPQFDFSINADNVELSKRKDVFTTEERINQTRVIWYCPLSTIKDEWGEDLEAAKNKAAKYFKAITQEINSILSGEVYLISVGYFDQVIESCGGFVGLESAKKELEEWKQRDYSKEVAEINSRKIKEFGGFTREEMERAILAAGIDINEASNEIGR